MDAVGLEYPSTADAGCAALLRLPLGAERYRRPAGECVDLVAANDLLSEIRPPE